MAQHYVFLNGKRTVVESDAKVGDLDVASGDIVMRQVGGAFQPVSPTEPIRENDRLTTVPHVDKGAVYAGPSPWVQQDLDLLRGTLGGRAPVATLPIAVGGAPYLAVEIANVRLNQVKFKGRTRGKLLFLLPQSYPAATPIGVYINYPFEMREVDHHGPQGLDLRTFYGAPNLVESGWYWYCLQPMQPSAWRPHANPADGHNLLSLFAAASHAVNS